MLIINNRWLRFLVGASFVLLLQPATATDDEHDLHQSRELTGTGNGGSRYRSPPWATGSICTPDGPFYDPNAVAQCKDCCQEQKCHDICLNQCKSNAASTAQNRKNYCRSYDGDKKDGAPAWGTCSDELGEYKESHCSDYDGCVTKYEAKHVANDAWYYCDDLKPPRRDCSGFGECVVKKIAVAKKGSALKACKAGEYVNFAKTNCDDKLGSPECLPSSPPACTEAQCTDYAVCVYDFYALDAQRKHEAEESCDPSKWDQFGEDCKYFAPEWHPDCGDSHDDWYEACDRKDCDEILKDLQYADAHSKSGSKGRHAVCDDFWDCVNDYERYNENSESREKGDDARSDCKQCENSGRDCKDVVGDDHEQGKNDVCLDYLGGWERSCNSYYDCWNSRLKGECEDCANGNGSRCFNKYDSCKATCMASPDVCEAECDVCFCESSDSNLAIERCQAIGDDCCNDPYGWLNDPDMKSYLYIRECTPSDDCGTCGGNCNNNADCHGVNVCSKDYRNPRNIYDIPGCKGDPAKVKDRNGKSPPLAPENIGYCYKPPSVKEYPDRTYLINSCLAQTTTNGYGRCCGLPQFASQCGQTFNNYCDTRPDFPLIQPGTPGTGDTIGTPIFEAVTVQYTGSYCGTSVEQICSSCPSNINDVRECSDCTNDPDPDVGCFSDFICEDCLVQTGSVERSSEP